MQHKKRLITIQELQEMTRLSRRYLYQKIEDGEIPAYKFGKSKGMRVALDDAVAFIESKRI